MNKTAISNGWIATPEWFRAMQTPSYSRSSDEVGYLPPPNGIGGTWKTLAPATGTIDVDTWAYNVLVVPTAWADTFSYAGVSIKNSIMVICPKWAAAGAAVTSCTFAQSEGATLPILRGNVLLVIFGADGKVSGSFGLPASSMTAIATFGELTVNGTISVPAGSILAAMIASAAIRPRHLKANFFALGGDVYAMFPTGADPESLSLLINDLAVKPSHLSPAAMVKTMAPIPLVFAYDGTTWAGMDKSFLLDLDSFGQYLDTDTYKKAVAAGDIVTAKIWVWGGASTGSALLSIGSNANYVTQDIDISSATTAVPKTYSKDYTITADDITRGWIQVKCSASLFDGSISVNLMLTKGS